MKILTQFELNGKASYPDDYRLFTNMEQVEIEGELYWLCNYTGSKDLENGTHTYESWQETLIKPTIKLSNFVIKANNTTVEPQYDIYRVGINETISASATIEDADGVLLSIMETTAKPNIEMDIIVERIKSGDVSSVIDDTRFGVTMTDKEMTLDVNTGFTIGGNYVITQERLNQGLDTLGTPFNIEMPKIEFNALNK